MGSERSSSRGRRTEGKLPFLLSGTALPARFLNRRDIHIAFLSPIAATHTRTAVSDSDEILIIPTLFQFTEHRMAPKDNCTLSSVKAPGELIAKKCRGMESIKYTQPDRRGKQRCKGHRKQEIIQKHSCEENC